MVGGGLCLKKHLSWLKKIGCFYIGGNKDFKCWRNIFLGSIYMIVLVCLLSIVYQSHCTIGGGLGSGYYVFNLQKININNEAGAADICFNCKTNWIKKGKWHIRQVNDTDKNVLSWYISTRAMQFLLQARSNKIRPSILCVTHQMSR